MSKAFDWYSLTEIQQKDVLLAYETCVAFINHEKNLTHLTLEEFRKGCYLLVGRRIYECKSLEFWSGLCSENVLKEIEEKGWSKARKTREHALGRGNSAKVLYDYMLRDGSNFEEFKELFVEYCFYHWTTYAENNAVKVYVDRGMDWISAYAKVGILLYETVFVRQGIRKVIQKKIAMTPTKLRMRFAY